MPGSSEKSIFLQALELESRAARNQFLEHACGENESLKASVQQLLKAHETSDTLLDAPVAEWRPVDGDLLDDTLIMESGITEEEGTIINGYRLMEQIGEGGFGLVFVAEQHKPVRRRVALKILKPGMDSWEIVTRFEAERQALALMDHPNIASVYDAGTTETGRPYFVMELVRGRAITEFCDKHALRLEDRLKLFCSVCNAVQHAHQKGIIHRDIKPSNILVAQHDGAPVVKVIDFGVAKAIGQKLTDKTIYTRFTAMIGTPLYMSPEQAEMGSVDVDTRSDVYSLGVLLYELLTGTTPFDVARMNSASYDELRQIIREEEPPRPSDRLTTLGQTDATIATKRIEKFGMLPRFVRGDLDWIVVKAMEKDRRRRYESAGSLATDVRRYLSNDAIEARPPSQWYRLQKLARRHKVVLVTTSLVAISLLLGTVISIKLAAKAIGERNDKDRALRDAVIARNDATAAQKQIEEFADTLKEASILVTSGRAHADAGRLSSAYADYSKAIAVQPNYYSAWLERASLQVDVSVWKPAAKDFERALELGVPADNPANWGIAQLFLYTGNETAYRAYCDSMIQLANQSSQSASIAAIRSYVVAPSPVIDPTDLATQAEALLTAMTEEELNRPERREGPRGPPPPDDRGNPPNNRKVFHPRGAVLYIVGMAHYRAKHFEAAIDRFQQTLDDPDWWARGITYPALAMAFHRNGQAEEARKAFESSAAAINEWTEQMVNGPVGSKPVPWFDWIEVKLLHAEASVLLTGYAPVDDPRLRELEDRGQAAIRE